MKFLAVLVVALLAFIAWRMNEQPRKEAEERKAVEALQRLVAVFPKSAQRNLGERTRLFDVSYNVKKSDSVSAPLIGMIGFSEPLYLGKDVRYDLVYHWQDGVWKYQRLICRAMDVNVPVFEAGMEASPEINWFTTHGTPQPAVAVAEKVAMPASTPAPHQGGEWMWKKGSLDKHTNSTRQKTDQERMAEWAARVRDGR